MLASFKMTMHVKTPKVQTEASRLSQNNLNVWFGVKWLPDFKNNSLLAEYTTLVSVVSFRLGCRSLRNTSWVGLVAQLVKCLSSTQEAVFIPSSLRGFRESAP